jgi:hypothetical protein
MKLLSALKAWRHYRQVPVGMYGCWRDKARPHPWEKKIREVACGYLEQARHGDVRCVGCVLQHWPETTWQQLDKLKATGDAAGELR